MKIIYAVQGTGNGHISRANQLVPELEKYGTVHVFLSGSNYTLQPNFRVRYASKGLSLFYNECGSISISRTFKDNSLRNAMKDARELPVENYDLIINDFDFVTAMACRKKNVNSVQLGHQASFMSANTPRPTSKNWLGEWVLKNFANSTQYMGFHFKEYDSFIYPPVVKNEIMAATPVDMGHVSIYLPSMQAHCLQPVLANLKDIPFHWFLAGIEKVYTEGNITYYPINDKLFTDSLVKCHGLITGGGFETPSEALFLGKKLMSIPIDKHYEQQCNAAALEKMGVKTLLSPSMELLQAEIALWYEDGKVLERLRASNVPSVVEKLVATV